MAEKIVTLYLDDTSVRVLMTSGKRIKKWADVPLEPGLVKNAVILKQDEVAAKIKQLFKVRKLNSKRVVLGMSGLHCLTRPLTLPELPRDMLEEAVTREAKRVLPVPLEQLYYSWQSVPAPEGKVQVFLVAVPRKAADAVFGTLNKAGLKSYLVDLKPMLLARLVKETMAIIMDVQPTEFDIIVMAGGIPQPIRTVHIPSEVTSWKDKLSLIRNELGRTIEFYASNNPEMPIDPSLPIYISGELADEPDACRQLSEELKRPLLPLSAPLENPNGLNPQRYLANMGLVLKKLAPSNGSGLSVASINIVPEAYQPEPISITRIITVPIAVVAIGLLFLLAALTQNTSADAANIRNQLDTTSQLLQQKLAQREALSGTIAQLQSQITEAETSGGNFAGALENLESASNQVNGDLEVTISCLSDTISLSSISYAGTALTIKGQAPSEDDILSYVGELEASEWFSRITITSIRRTSGQSMDFSLSLIEGE
jgi:type IV pilus assembly protein PilM